MGGAGDMSLPEGCPRRVRHLLGCGVLHEIFGFTPM